MTVELEYGIDDGGDSATSAASTSPLDRLLVQYREKPLIRAWIAAYLEQTDELKAEIARLKVERSITDGVGAQLDAIGRLLGAPRNGLLDPEYRRRLATQILINRSRGKTEEILTVFLRLADPDALVRLAEYSCSILMTVLQDAPFDAEQANDALQTMKGAGIKASLVYGIADSFRYGSDTSVVTSDTHGYGDSTTPTDGGAYPNMIGG